MKILILPFFALLTSGSNAQFSIVPQIGLETFKTTITPENLSSFSPVGLQLNPSLAVRMAYTLKSGQGAFLGVATSSPSVKFQFTDPRNAQTSYLASAKDLQVRLEAGYQFTSKPITLKKPVSKATYSPQGQRYSAGKPGGGCVRSMCGRMRNSAGNDNKLTLQKVTPDNGFYMRIKPSLGLAIVPLGSTMATEIKGGQPQYTYTAGLNTAVIAGTAFEFGTRNQPKFIVSVNYLKGLSNNTQTVISNDYLKSSATTFSSKTSGFNINFGIPFSLKKKAPVVEIKPVTSPSRYGHCGRYRTYQL